MNHLNRRSIKAVEASAKATQRIAVAQEKSVQPFLDYLFSPENADLLKPSAGNQTEPPRPPQPRKRQ